MGVGVEARVRERGEAPAQHRVNRGKPPWNPAIRSWVLGPCTARIGFLDGSWINALIFAIRPNFDCARPAMSSRVSLRVYDGEGMLPDIVRLIETQLRCVATLTQRALQHLYLPLLSAPVVRCTTDPGPSSVFSCVFFFLTQAYMDDAQNGTVPVGVIINKLDRHLRGARMYRGYIAMLSVDPQWRGHGIGTLPFLPRRTARPDRRGCHGPAGRAGNRARDRGGQRSRAAALRAPRLFARKTPLSLLPQRKRLVPARAADSCAAATAGRHAAPSARNSIRYHSLAYISTGSSSRPHGPWFRRPPSRLLQCSPPKPGSRPAPLIHLHTPSRLRQPMHLPPSQRSFAT